MSLRAWGRAIAVRAPDYVRTTKTAAAAGGRLGLALPTTRRRLAGRRLRASRRRRAGFGDCFSQFATRSPPRPRRSSASRPPPLRTPPTASTRRLSAPRRARRSAGGRDSPPPAEWTALLWSDALDGAAWTARKRARAALDALAHFGAKDLRPFRGRELPMRPVSGRRPPKEPASTRRRCTPTSRAADGAPRRARRPGGGPRLRARTPPPRRAPSPPSISRRLAPTPARVISSRCGVKHARPFVRSSRRTLPESATRCRRRRRGAWRHVGARRVHARRRPARRRPRRRLTPGGTRRDRADGVRVHDRRVRGVDARASDRNFRSRPRMVVSSSSLVTRARCADGGIMARRRAHRRLGGRASAGEAPRPAAAAPHATASRRPQGPTPRARCSAGRRPRPESRAVGHRRRRRRTSREAAARARARRNRPAPPRRSPPGGARRTRTTRHGVARVRVVGDAQARAVAEDRPRRLSTTRTPVAGPRRARTRVDLGRVVGGGSARATRRVAGGAGERRRRLSRRRGTRRASRARCASQPTSATGTMGEEPHDSGASAQLLVTTRFTTLREERRAGNLGAGRSAPRRRSAPLNALVSFGFDGRVPRPGRSPSATRRETPSPSPPTPSRTSGDASRSTAETVRADAGRALEAAHRLSARRTRRKWTRARAGFFQTCSVFRFPPSTREAPAPRRSSSKFFSASPTAPRARRGTADGSCRRSSSPSRDKSRLPRRRD